MFPRLLCLCILLAALPAAAQITHFSLDVHTAIDRGLDHADAQGWFDGECAVNGNGDATGLIELALLEKREDADQRSVSVGYARATPADQARMDRVLGMLIARVNAGPARFRAYQDGADLMALSVYHRTGGPDQAGSLAAIHTLVERIVANQGAHGYWCYIDGSCQDSSTTQLVMAGVAAARGVFLDNDDADRLAAIDAAAAAARAGYVANTRPGDLSPDEAGHGYRAGVRPSLQQTASGIWGQLVGGADLNDPNIQAYLRWLAHRYQYGTFVENGGWPATRYYWMWAFEKAMSYIEESGILPDAGHITPADLGALAPGDVPAYMHRQQHIDPATSPRAPSMGPDGPGYYADPNEPARWYFDLARTLLEHQQPDGLFVQDDGRPWNPCSGQAYAILVLERSLGGGCIDGDGDGVCDRDDLCPAEFDPDQADADGDGIGDACDPEPEPEPEPDPEPEPEPETVCCQVCETTVQVPADQCRLAGGSVVPDGECCPQVCCALPDGSRRIVKSEHCLISGEIVDLAECGAPEPDPVEEICCAQPDGSVVSVPLDACAAADGRPVELDVCENVCCRANDRVWATPAEYCPGEGVGVEQCLETCCQLPDGARATLDRGRCVDRGGVEAPAEWCAPDVCCVTPGGDPRSMPADRCAAGGGAEGAEALCLAVCCETDDGRYETSAGACESAGGDWRRGACPRPGRPDAGVGRAPEAGGGAFATGCAVGPDSNGPAPWLLLLLPLVGLGRRRR